MCDTCRCGPRGSSTLSECAAPRRGWAVRAWGGLQTVLSLRHRRGVGESLQPLAHLVHCSWRERELLCDRVQACTAAHTDQWIERWTVRARKGSFIQKASTMEKMVNYCPRNHATWARSQASFILKGEGLWLVLANFLVPESFVLTVVHVGLVTVFL